MLTLDPVQQVADEFRQQADEGQPSPAEQKIANDWASSGSIEQQRDLPPPSTSPSGGGGSVDYGNSNLERLASMMPPPTPDQSDETVTAPLTIQRMATQAIQPPSFMGGSVANLPGYDTSNTPQTLGGQAFAAGLPQPEQPTLLSAIDSLPGISDQQRIGLQKASPYIRDRLNAGQSFPAILEDILGTPNMDTLHAASALLNEPARILQHYTDKAVAPAAENTLGRIPVVGPEASKLVEGAAPFAIEGKVPVAGGPLITQQLLFQVASTAEGWQQGKIDTKTAAEQLAPIVGGVAAGPFLKLIGKGASAAGVTAGEWLKSPEGQQALSGVGAKLAEERGSLGTGPEEPADLSNSGTAKSMKAQQRIDAFTRGELTPQDVLKIDPIQRGHMIDSLQMQGGQTHLSTEEGILQQLLGGGISPQDAQRQLDIIAGQNAMTETAKIGRSAETGAAVPVAGQAGAPPPSEPSYGSPEERFARGKPLPRAQMNQPIDSTPMTPAEREAHYASMDETARRFNEGPAYVAGEDAAVNALEDQIVPQMTNAEMIRYKKAALRATPDQRRAMLDEWQQAHPDKPLEPPPPSQEAPQPAVGSSGGVPPVEPPVAAGGGSGEKPPTIREIEARSKPSTVEERAAMPRDTSQAFFSPETTSEVTKTAIKSDMDNYQRIQNLIQKVPGLKSVGTYIESVGAAKGQEKLGNPIPMAMVKRDITIGRQSSAARAGLLGWAGKVRETLGLDPNGIAHDVQVRDGASIPKKIAQRLDDIVEHPEGYNLTPEQKAALVPVEHTLNASTQHALNAGVDVNEIRGPYFPRTITKGPKGESGGGGVGNRLTSKPGFAKSRVFPDTRSAVAAGYQVATPMEALGDRLISGVKATANKEAYKEILALGEKPSARIPQATKEALPAAREAYKAARKSGDARAIELAAKELDSAKRDLRKAGLKAATPTMGETKAYGRIFTKPVMDELAKYGDVHGPGVVDEFFAIQRANETTLDHSSLLVQGGNLLYRNPVAWMKAAAYSTASFAREPWGWASRNMPEIEAAIKDGAAQPPSDFLRSEGPLSQKIGQIPVIKQTQRMFEWMTFIGQVEWHKAAMKMDMTPLERQEMGAVVRKGMGSSSMPGVTSRMRAVDRSLWYAGGFMRSTLGLMADASRMGARGAEARKTLGMVIGGATALTIGLQYAVDRTMPNLTNPNDKNKRWGYVEFPGGGVNLYGPLFPYIKLVAKAGQDLGRGDYGAAAGEGQSFAAGKASLPIRTAIDLRSGQTFTGDKIAPGWKGTLEYLSQQAEPLGIRQSLEGALHGQLQQFPEQGLELVGGRTTPNSEYQLANRALIDHGVADGMNASPGDKAKARAQFPDVAKAMDAYDQSTIDKGTTGGQIKVARGDAIQAQKDADAALESGQMSVSQWKDARKSVNDTLSGAIWQITKGQPYTSGDKVLDGYYAVFHDFQKAGGSIIDKQGLQDALDRYTSSLSPADQKHLDENTGLAETTPKVKEYRAAVKQLSDAGFFDQEKMGYQSAYWQKQFAAAKSPLAKNGLMPDKFNSLGAMKANYVAAYTKAHANVDPQVAAADGAREFERIGAVKQFRGDLQKHIQTFYKSNPNLLRLATEWGFNTLSKAEEKILAGAR